MVEIAPEVSSLLSNCRSSDPPFDKLIKKTLSSLSTSRFQFAIQLQQALESSRDRLDPLQVICILCAVYQIGGGVGTATGTGTGTDVIISNTPEDVNVLGRVSGSNAFSTFLKRYRSDAVSIMADINKDRQESSYLSLPLLNIGIQTGSGNGTGTGIEESPSQAASENGYMNTNSYNTNTTTSMPIHAPFFRPLPPLTTSTHCEGSQPPFNLRFVHTSYPSLRYEWLQPQDPKKPSTEELFDKMFHTPLEHEEENSLLLYCRQKGIDALTGNHHHHATDDPQEYEQEQSFPNDGVPPVGALLTPQNIPALVQHNPNIAIHLLLPLPPAITSRHTQLYHSALVQMDITLHTMEVVYKLATNHLLTKEDLHIFVLALFERCTKMEGGGTATAPTSTSLSNVQVVGGESGGMSSTSMTVTDTTNNVATTGEAVSASVIRNDRKMVRLVSVFLQNLISNGIVNVEDFVEVQAFCIENSRVREANALFKLIKESRSSSKSSSSLSSSGSSLRKGGKGSKSGS